MDIMNTAGFPEHAQRWPFTNRDHEGHRVQTSVHFSLLGFHGFSSLYGSFSCVFPRSTCVFFNGTAHLVVTNLRFLCNTSKTSVSVSSWFQTREN